MRESGRILKWVEANRLSGWRRLPPFRLRAMAEISYQDLRTYLQDLEAPGRGLPAPIHLIHGEDLFVRLAFDEILGRILPGAQESLNYEPVDGAATSVGDVVELLNTYSLLGGVKVVALKDARLFHTQEDAAKLLDSARKAFKEGDVPRAARHFLAALAQMNLSLEEMKTSGRTGQLPSGYDPGEDDAWIDRILEHCAAGRLTVPAAADAAGIFEKAVENGFPKGHYLLITTDIVDRRRNLYKLISTKGVVVDCSAPKGDRKADREAQEMLLFEHAKTLLEQHRMTMNRAALLALCEVTGFEPGIFSNNLRILIDYAGDRREITAEDVAAVLTRTKKDPLYELTNAVTDRNLEQSLFFLGSLLEGEIHGLQALAAITNQVRKLLAAKDFVESPPGAAWHPTCGYPQFQKMVMPAVVQFDRELVGRLEGWENALADASSEGKKKKKTKVSTDLVLARNPANAYPVYQLLKKSDRFSRVDLLKALEAVAEADIKLKSSPLNPRLILERVVLQICSLNSQEDGDAKNSKLRTRNPKQS
jgi:DNA polymerase-3 subunit delta